MYNLSNHNLPNPSVLLAEDDPDSREILKMILERSGYAVTTAEDGEDYLNKALSAWGSGDPFKLMIVDIQLPKMKGTTATSILRSKGYSMPIVAITALNLGPERSLCLEAGFNDFINKLEGKASILEAVKNNLSHEEHDYIASPEINLPALPIIPELVMNDRSQKERVLKFLERLPENYKELSQAVILKNLELCSEISLNLGSASIFEYHAFSGHLQRLQINVSKENWKEAGDDLKKLGQVVESMLAGIPHIKKLG